MEETSYSCIRPLAEALDQQGLTDAEAFEVLKDDRRGVSQGSFRSLVGGYFPAATPERKAEAAARAWSVAQPSQGGWLSLPEWRRLLSRAWEARSTDVEASGTVGLSNLGNTCYMNAVLQCLAGSGDLLRYFLGPPTGLVEQDLHEANPKGSGGAVAREMQFLLRAVWDSSDPGPLKPVKLKEAISKACSRFSGADQEDAQEFALCLLNALHEDLNRVRTRRPYVAAPDVTPAVLERKGEERVAAESWLRYLASDRSIVVDLFQGQLRSQITCLECNYRSTKFDPFMYLSLPMIDEGGAPLTSLADCLSEFAREEHLSGDDRWFCPECRRRVDVTKGLTVWKWPPVLVVHFKRFRFEASSDWRRQPRASKVDHHVDFDLEEMDLQSVAGARQKEAPIFNLFALVDHHGRCQGGHYTASVRHNLSGRWHRFDDSRVYPIKAEDVPTDAAYMLFYRRRTEGGCTDLPRQSLSRPEEWPHFVSARASLLRGLREDGNESCNSLDLKRTSQASAPRSSRRAEDDDDRDDDDGRAAARGEERGSAVGVVPMSVEEDDDPAGRSRLVSAQSHGSPWVAEERHGYDSPSRQSKPRITFEGSRSRRSAPVCRSQYEEEDEEGVDRGSGYPSRRLGSCGYREAGARFGQRPGHGEPVPQPRAANIAGWLPEDEPRTSSSRRTRSLSSTVHEA